MCGTAQICAVQVCIEILNEGVCASVTSGAVSGFEQSFSDQSVSPIHPFPFNL